MGKYTSDPIEIISIDSHRNGIGGNSFYVIIFKTPDIPDDTMLAIVFRGHGNTAVIGLGMAYEHNNIAFGSNSYRYEFFEDVLHDAVEKFENKRRKEWGLTPLTENEKREIFGLSVLEEMEREGK
jgi:hypothetical protein